VFPDVRGRLFERNVGRIRFRCPRQVDHGLCKVQTSLRQADVLNGLRSGDGNQQRPRVGVAYVLRGEHDHPPRDEPRVLPALQHRREVVDGRVRVGAAHRLDEGRDEVVVRIAGLVVDERPLASGVLDVLLEHGLVLGAGGLNCELEDVQRVACVAARPPRYQRDELVAQLRLERLDAMTRNEGELLLGQRLQLVDLAAREQCRVDLEIWVLGGRSDQRHQAFLDPGQQRVLLCLVEAVDLVEEEDRPLSGTSEPVSRARQHRTHVRDRGRHRRELLECRAGGLGDDSGERRLAASRGPEEDHRADAVLRDREPERRSLAQDLVLAYELAEGPWPQAKRQRRHLVHPLSGRVGEQVAHRRRSMLRPVRTTAEPLVSRISVIYLYVSDTERSAAFYRDVLGIPLEGDGDWQEASLDGLRFALHRMREGIGELSSGTIHVNLEVPDIDAAAERLRASGVEAGEVVRDDWGAALEVSDPDGYRLYLYQPPR